MRFRSEVVDCQSRIEADVERNIMSGSHAGGRWLRSDSRAVWNLIGIWCKTIAGLSAGGVTRNVSGSDNHRKNKLVSSILVFQCLNITNRDLDFFPRKNVCDRLGEDIWSFLVQQAGHLSTCFRSFINSLCLLAWQDFSTHNAITNQHGHVVNRGVVWQRKDVDSFNLFLERIFKVLCDDYARQKAADFDLHIGVF